MEEKRRRPRSTPGERDEAVALYEGSGRTAAAVATGLGVPQKTLESWIRLAGHPAADSDGAMTEGHSWEFQQLRRERAAGARGGVPEESSCLLRELHRVHLERRVFTMPGSVPVVTSM